MRILKNRNSILYPLVGVVMAAFLVGCQQQVFVPLDASCGQEADEVPVDTSGEFVDTDSQSIASDEESVDTNGSQLDTGRDGESETGDSDSFSGFDGGFEVTNDEILEDKNGRCIRVVDGQGRSQSPDGLSWVTAFQDVRDGIAAAEEGLKNSESLQCEVWVRRGVYPLGGKGVLNSVILSSNIWLIGGFTGDETDLRDRNPRRWRTVLDGESTLYHVVAVLPREEGEVVSNVVIDGFSIRRGFANGQHPINRMGAGLYVDEARLEVRNVVFEDNMAFGAGSVRIFQSDPLQNVVFRNCTFARNWAFMATVLANYGRSKPRFVNCLFVDNVSELDASISMSVGSGMPGFVNCTFVRNISKSAENAPDSSNGLSLVVEEYEAGGRGGSYFYEYYIGTTSIANSIFDLNTPTNIFPGDSRSAPVYFSLVQPGALDSVGLPIDDTCIEGHASFVDPAGGDFRLTRGSKGVDQGTAIDFSAGKPSNIVEIPEDDILGNPRDSSPDMGAYERQM